MVMAAGIMGAVSPAAAGIMTAFEGEDLPMKASDLAASFMVPAAVEAVFMAEAGSMEAVTAGTGNLREFRG